MVSGDSEAEKGKEKKKEFIVVEGLILPCFKPIHTPFSHSATSFSPHLSSSHSCFVSFRYYIEIILICQV